MEDTWADLLEPQWLDLVLLVAFFTLALVGFFRKSVALKYVTMAAALGYLGFMKSDLVSIVNIFSLLTGHLPLFRYNLAWYLFIGFTLVSTALWGRVYCGRICAFGALTQLMDRVVPAALRVDVPVRVEKRINNTKYLVLVGVLAYFLTTSDMHVYRYVEPFWMFGVYDWADNPALWMAVGFLLVATVFVRNLYCRFLCPVGAFLGVISKVSTVFPIKRWKECGTCKLCEKVCEWGAIRGPEIVKSECVRCDDCERLYADEDKCPHWIIILKKKPAPQAVPTSIQM